MSCEVLQPGAKLTYRPRHKRRLVTARIVAAHESYVEVVSPAGFACVRYEQIREVRR